MPHKTLSRKENSTQGFNDFSEDDSREQTRNQFDISEALKRRHEKQKDQMLREKRRSKVKSRQS